MRKSFVHSGSPMLIGVIREETVRGAIAAIRNCEYHGATALDLHLSCLTEEARTVENLKKIIDASRLPIMALSYNQAYDNTPIDLPEEDRLELLLRQRAELLERREKIDAALVWLEKKIDRYEDAVKTGVLEWGNRMPEKE